MKTTTLKAIAAVGLSALLAGNAAAQATESRSKPVGYETITIPNGFSYAGIRLHEAPVESGEISAVTASGISDDTADFSGLAAGNYILEIENAVGTNLTFTAVTDDQTVPTSSDVSALVSVGDKYTIRPASTLAGVFGATDADVVIDKGFSGTGGADQIWVVNPAGGFDKYFFDEFSEEDDEAEWVNVDTKVSVNPSNVPLFYTSGLILVGAGTENNSFIVSGSVKTTASSIAHIPGFNYLSVVSPAGATLESMFGSAASVLADNTSLAAGFSGTGGADQVWVPRSGAFDKYFVDEFAEADDTTSWVNVDTKAVVTPSDVMLDSVSGFIIVNQSAAKTTPLGVPSFYDTL